MPLANDAQGCGMAHCPCLILPKVPGAELVRQSMADSLARATYSDISSQERGTRGEEGS